MGGAHFPRNLVEGEVDGLGFLTGTEMGFGQFITVTGQIGKFPPAGISFWRSDMRRHYVPGLGGCGKDALRRRGYGVARKDKNTAEVVLAASISLPRNHSHFDNLDTPGEGAPALSVVGGNRPVEAETQRRQPPGSYTLGH